MSNGNGCGPSFQEEFTVKDPWGTFPKSSLLTQYRRIAKQSLSTNIPSKRQIQISHRDLLRDTYRVQDQSIQQFLERFTNLTWGKILTYKNKRKWQRTLFLQQAVAAAQVVDAVGKPNMAKGVQESMHTNRSVPLDLNSGNPKGPWRNNQIFFKASNICLVGFRVNLL